MFMICRDAGMRVMAFKFLIGMIMGQTRCQRVRRSRISEQ